MRQPKTTLFNRLQQTAVWQSIFRSGSLASNLGRSKVIFNNLVLHILPAKVKRSTLRFTATFYLGFLSFSLFVILSVTGVLLMLYYHPSVPQAYWDVKDLQFVVTSGTLLRNLHRWSAHFMVAFVWLHMLRVFYTGAFAPPKQFNWMVGVMLLILTLVLSYTGYLLPWDQLAYWAVNVGTNMVEAMPILGKAFKFLLIGGNFIGENTLLRFYVLHCVILPLVLTMLVAVHFWRIRKDGGIKPLFDEPQKGEGENDA